MIKSKIVLIFVAVFLTISVRSYAQNSGSSVKTRTDAWVIEYEKNVFPLSTGELTEQSVELEGKDEVSISFSFFLEFGLFSFEEKYCQFFAGKDVKEKLMAIFLDPEFVAIIVNLRLEDLAEEYLEKNPGKSPDDPEWKEMATRVETEFRAKFEAWVRSIIQQFIVIDATADSEIVLFGGTEPLIVSKIVNPKKLRSFMASMQTLTKTVIRELQENKKLSESTQKQLDALAGLTPEQYGMAK